MFRCDNGIHTTFFLSFSSYSLFDSFLLVLLLFVNRSVHDFTFFNFSTLDDCRHRRTLRIFELMLQYGEQWLVKWEHILDYLHNGCMIGMGQQVFFRILFCLAHVFVSVSLCLCASWSQANEWMNDRFEFQQCVRRSVCALCTKLIYWFIYFMNRWPIVISFLQSNAQINTENYAKVVFYLAWIGNNEV